MSKDQSIVKPDKWDVEEMVTEEASNRSFIPTSRWVSASASFSLLAITAYFGRRVQVLYRDSTTIAWMVFLAELIATSLLRPLDLK